MSTDVAHRRWWQTFEVVFGIPLLVAIILQRELPFSLPLGFLEPVVTLGGAALTILGAVLILLARRRFAEHGQPTDPGHATSQIVTTGVFAYSRNPFYLGGVCMLAGIALLLQLPWILVLLLPACVGCHYVLVAPEEQYLAAKFGDEYQTYTASVHRWIGRAQCPRNK